MCNSGEYHEEIYDARGIYVTRVCNKCAKTSLAPYRRDIFINSQYETDEPIESED